MYFRLVITVVFLTYVETFYLIYIRKDSAVLVRSLKNNPQVLFVIYKLQEPLSYEMALIKSFCGEATLLRIY